MKLEWSDKYSVGVDFIDQQHKKIFEYIERVEELGTRHKSGVPIDKDEVRAVIEALKAYTVSHFHDEELIMERANYRGIERHKEIHRNLIKSLEILETKFEVVGLDILDPLTTFITRWLTDHILGVDRKYTPFVGKRASV